MPPTSYHVLAILAGAAGESVPSAGGAEAYAGAGGARELFSFYVERLCRMGFRGFAGGALMGVLLRGSTQELRQTFEYFADDDLGAGCAGENSDSQWAASWQPVGYDARSGGGVEGLDLAVAVDGVGGLDKPCRSQVPSELIKVARVG